MLYELRLHLFSTSVVYWTLRLHSHSASIIECICGSFYVYMVFLFVKNEEIFPLFSTPSLREISLRAVRNASILNLRTKNVWSSESELYSPYLTSINFIKHFLSFKFSFFNFFKTFFCVCVLICEFFVFVYWFAFFCDFFVISPHSRS